MTALLVTTHTKKKHITVTTHVIVVADYPISAKEALEIARDRILNEIVPEDIHIMCYGSSEYKQAVETVELLSQKN